MSESTPQHLVPQWSIESWNSALLEAVFYAEEIGSSQITRMDATDGFLAQVAGVSDERGSEVRESFIALFRRVSDQVPSFLDAHTVRETWDPDAEQPNFFATLYLTLIVASATEETHDQGNFRVRLATLLGLDGSPNYVPSSLPLLWEDLAEWSAKQAEAGEPVRQLVLPDPQNESIIGYSKRLAFPSFKDLDRLSILMGMEDMCAESPIDMILGAIGGERRFSETFNREFTVFRALVEAGESDLAQSTPFWGALEAVSWKPQLDEAKHDRVHVRLSLDVGRQGSEAALEILVDREDVGIDASCWRVEDLPTPLDNFVGFLTGDPSQGEGAAAASLLARDDGPGSLVSGTYLDSAIAQGCICFVGGESIRWVDSRGLPSSGPVRLLMRQDIFDSARAAFSGQGIKVPLDTPLGGVEGWRLLEAVKCDDGLSQLSHLYPFSELDVFKAKMPRPLLELRGAIRMRDGVLFLRPILPLVAVEYSDSVDVVSLRPDSPSGISGLLTRSAESDEALFEFSRELADSIAVPGSLRLRALQRGKSVRSRNFDLIRTCSSRSRRGPQPFSNWLVDGVTGQLAPAQDTWGAIDDDRDNELMGKSHLKYVVSRISSAPNVHDPDSNGGVVAWRPLESLPPEWGELLESLAGVFSCRKGASVSDVLTWIARGFEIEERQAWSVLDCLSYNSLVVRLYTRRWRGQTLFAQDPVLCHVAETLEPEARIFGLVAHHVRADICRVAREMGMEPQVAALGDWSGVGCIRIPRCTSEEAAEIGSRTGISLGSPSFAGEANSVRSPREILERLSPRVRVDQSGNKSEYWIGGRFREVPRIEDARLTFERRLYEGQQTNYILWVDDAPVWSTQSWSWASLIARRAMDQVTWKLGSDGVVSCGHAIPEVFARRALLSGDGVSGVNWKSGSSNRCLAFGSVAAARDALGEWLPLDVNRHVRSESLARWADAFGARNVEPKSRVDAFRRRNQVTR